MNALDRYPIRVECPHGLKVDTEMPWTADPRPFVRNLMLACPQCRREAEGWIEDAGA